MGLSPSSFAQPLPNQMWCRIKSHSWTQTKVSGDPQTLSILYNWPTPEKGMQRMSPDYPWSFHNPMPEFWRTDLAWMYPIWCWPTSPTGFLGLVFLLNDHNLAVKSSPFWFWYQDSSWWSEIKSILIDWYQDSSLHRTVYIPALCVLHTWGLHNGVPWSCAVCNKDNHL